MFSVPHTFRPFLFLSVLRRHFFFFFFFFNDTATTEIYTLSLHDALPISWRSRAVSEALATFFRNSLQTVAAMEAWSYGVWSIVPAFMYGEMSTAGTIDHTDRKSTRLNSSHT